MQIGCAWVGASTCPSGITDGTTGKVWPTSNGQRMLTCQYYTAGNGGGNGAFAQNVRPLQDQVSPPYTCYGSG